MQFQLPLFAVSLPASPLPPQLNKEQHVKDARRLLKQVKEVFRNPVGSQRATLLNALHELLDDYERKWGRL